MHAVTITSVQYVHTVDVPTPTPLDSKAIQRTVVDSYHVVFDVEGVLVGHELYFAPEAIGDRMKGYGLATADEAVAALVRETVFRWDDALQPADPTNAVDVNGGADVRITCDYSAATTAADRADTYAQHDERITLAQALPEPPLELPADAVPPIA